MLIVGARVFTNNHKFQVKDIELSGDIISGIFDAEETQMAGNSYRNEARKIQTDAQNEDVIDGTGLYAIPGLVDIHFHGAVGHDFCDADSEGFARIAEYEARNGVLAMCPATMTYSEEILEKVMEKAAAYKTADSRASLVGINMEGPFISPKRLGAQNPKYLANPDASMFRRLQTKSGNLIKLVDLAPELEGSMEFIKELSGEVTISIAHTDCSFDEATNAIKAGAGHITHLFNAMPGLSHREPGPIRAAMENESEVELIADGVHVHPSMVRFVFDTFSEDKIILISDSMEATGLPDGEYQLGGQPVKVNGKKAVLTGHPDTIAGSVTNLYECMKTAISMGIKKEAAIRAATENPAKSIGIDDEYGLIEPGYYANILLVDEEMNLKYVINKGKLIEKV